MGSVVTSLTPDDSITRHEHVLSKIVDKNRWLKHSFTRWKCGNLIKNQLFSTKFFYIACPFKNQLFHARWVFFHYHIINMLCSSAHQYTVHKQVVKFTGTVIFFKAQYSIYVDSDRASLIFCFYLHRYLSSMSTKLVGLQTFRLINYLSILE